MSTDICKILLVINDFLVATITFEFLKFFHIGIKFYSIYILSTIINWTISFTLLHAKKTNLMLTSRICKEFNARFFFA